MQMRRPLAGFIARYQPFWDRKATMHSARRSRSFGRIYKGPRGISSVGGGRIWRADEELLPRVGLHVCCGKHELIRLAFTRSLQVSWDTERGGATQDKRYRESLQAQHIHSFLSNADRQRLSYVYGKTSPGSYQNAGKGWKHAFFWSRFLIGRSSKKPK